MDSVQFSGEDEASSDEKSACSPDNPEIEVRVAQDSVLIKIHCGKQNCILANLLAKVECLNMVVMNTNVMPFGHSSLDITIIAEAEKGLSLTVKQVETSIRAAFQHAAT